MHLRPSRSHRIWSPLFALGGLVVAACSSAPQPEGTPPVAPGEPSAPETATKTPTSPRVHVSQDALPDEIPAAYRKPIAAVRPKLRTTAASTASPTAAGGKLSYNGGSVISDVKVLDVYWGNNVDATIRQQNGLEMSMMLSPTYMGWLDADYNTLFPGGTNQHINPGTWMGGKTIAPIQGGTDLCNGDVQSELQFQASIGAFGHIDANTALMVHFPPGITVHAGCFMFWNWGTTCADNCGFHDSTSIAGYDVPYAVLPDLSVPGCACNGGGGVAGDAFSVESHELIEMVTDPHPRSGWVDSNGAEIGDVCAWRETSIPGAGTYVAAQEQWSNAFHACIPFALGASADQLTVSPGQSAYISLISGVAATSYATPYYFWLSATSLPNGVTMQFLDSPTATLGNPRVKLTAAANAPLNHGAQFTAYGWDPTGTSPSYTYSLPMAVTVTCAAGTTYCDLQNNCVPTGSACTCAAGLQLCSPTRQCVANAADPAQCPPPQPFDCSTCACGCNGTATKCAPPVKCAAAACAKVGGTCDPCGGCM
jgi:hypothetical protein